MREILFGILGALGADRYAPLATALTYDPIVTVLLVAADIIIASSLLTMGVVAIRSRDYSDTNGAVRAIYGILALFLSGVFLLEIVLIFVGIFRLAVVMKASLAALAAVTIAVTYRRLMTRNDDR